MTAVVRRLGLTLLLSTPVASFSRHSVRMSSKLHSVAISDAFDGGNIQRLEASDDRVHLGIKKDPHTLLEDTQHFQYFCFRSTLTDDEQEVEYVIENAGEASYAKAFGEYHVFFSPKLSCDRGWTRCLSTKYQDGKLSWKHNKSGYFCYFPPYSYSRHLDFIAECQGKAKVSTLGQSLDGREIECIQIGSGERVCWMIHGQHPGEHMTGFYAEGLVRRLLGTNGSVDGLVARLLKMYTFYIVPNMNPDGSVRGHLRTNAGGQNLNREWADSTLNDEPYEAPTLERSPEVYHVLRKMDETGVDVFLDVHGDEQLPYNFIAGSEGLPVWSPRLRALHGALVASYERANSDMQAVYGYSPEPPKQGRMNVCSNQVGQRFDCLAGTLEMPFKDCWSNPDPERGWNPARAQQLGASVLDALSFVHPYLRDESSFWKDWPDADTYVEPTPDYPRRA